MEEKALGSQCMRKWTEIGPMDRGDGGSGLRKNFGEVILVMSCDVDVTKGQFGREKDGLTVSI